jgi:hypothetical protein
MIRHQKTPSTIAALAIVILACSSGTSGNDALDQLSSAFCARAAACCTGIVQGTCGATVSNAYKAVGFDTSQTYDSDSVSQCTSEIQALACPATGAACQFTVPKDCPAAGQTLPFLDNRMDAGGAMDSGSAMDSATTMDGGTE